MQTGWMRGTRSPARICPPRRAALWLTPCAALCLAAASPPHPPPARIGHATDSYFGHIIADPYRWMETPSAEFDAWTKAQDQATRAALAAIPGRLALRRHMDDIARAMTVVTAVTPVGHRIFFRRKDPDGDLAKLVVRDTDTGRDRVLLDPNIVHLGGRAISIDLFQPSQDGRYVAVGVAAGGPQGKALGDAREEVLAILDADTGHRLPDTIDRARFAAISWLPDGASFFYNRLPPVGRSPGPQQGPDAPPAATGQTVFLHHLGTDPARDVPVFGAGVAGTATMPPGDVVAVAAIIGTRFALGIQNDGVSPEIALYLSPIPEGAAGYRWRRIVQAQDGITDVAAGRDTLFFRSHANAPRYQVIAVTLDRPDLAASRVVVPQGDGVLTNIAVAADALYVAGRKGAASYVLRVTGDGRATPVPLPRAGSVAAPEEGAGALTADPRVPGAIVGIESWVAPPEYFGIGRDGPAVARLDAPMDAPKDAPLGAGTPVAVTPLGLSSPSASPTASPSAPQTAPLLAADRYVITETDVPANDGRTRLPLSIIERKGTPHDGHRPVLVEGYGAFGMSDEPDPRFVPVVRGWVDAGGVLAIAHVRGGGERGEAWHLAGQKVTKQNSIHDFIDCAWWMTELGYASPDTLAATGTGAGGITVGGAITQLPSLFRAALIRSGSTNPLRAEFGESGPASIREFGTVTIQAEFNALLAMDATQHVKAGVSYPAVLLTGSARDRHVPLWESAKMAARLQAAGAGAKGPALLRVEDAGGRDATGESQGGTAQNQSDAEWADGLAFLLWQIGVAGYQPSR
jgi:prolyl oligopeptidase